MVSQRKDFLDQYRTLPIISIYILVHQYSFRNIKGLKTVPDPDLQIRVRGGGGRGGAVIQTLR